MLLLIEWRAGGSHSFVQRQASSLVAIQERSWIIV
jgi:hypothetical protein